MTPRLATPADTDTLAALHLAVWRQTYGALAPARVVQALDLAHRRRGWAAILADPQKETWVLGADMPRALVCLGPAGHPAFGARGEIKHLYVDATQRGQGAGARLLRHALARLQARGFTGAGLGVLRANHAARAFYAAQGGAETGAYTDPGPLWPSDNVLVTWDWADDDAQRAAMTTNATT